MTDRTPSGPSSTYSPVSQYALTTSYRFDADMAALLTAFQYATDDITLTSTESRRLPQESVTPRTDGLAAVFEPDTSLVFITYDDRSHRMTNPIETSIITAITGALTHYTPCPTDPTEIPVPRRPSDAVLSAEPSRSTEELSVGVVTPHNAQRGVLDAELPERVTANTVEKYQGDERDVIGVAATVSDPSFARDEEQFILDARRLLVAISRSRYLTVVVASRSLFEVVPRDPEALEHGPIWARLFSLVRDGDPTPAWDGSLNAFTPTPTDESISIAVYPH